MLFYNGIPFERNNSLLNVPTMQFTEGRSSRTTRVLRPQHLRVYGGGGKAPRWELTYSCVPETEERSEYTMCSQVGSKRGNGGELPRELSKRQEQEEDTTVLDEGGPYTFDEHSFTGVTDLFCDEGLGMEQCDFISEGGEYNGSNGGSGIWYPKGLRGEQHADNSLYEEFANSVQRVLSEVTGFHEHSGLGSEQDPILVGGDRHREDQSSEASSSKSDLHKSFRRAEELEREIQWNNIRRYELPPLTQRSPDSSPGYLRRASDSLPTRVCSDSCWYGANCNEQSVPWATSGGNRSGYQKTNDLLGGHSDKKGKEKVGEFE